jgi:hypothetical protein
MFKQDEIIWQNEVLEMARQAGWPDWEIVSMKGELKTFVKLVEDKVTERYMQLFLDPENQPTQFGTATQEYRELEIKYEREMCVKAVATALAGKTGRYEAIRAIRARGVA